MLRSTTPTPAEETARRLPVALAAALLLLLALSGCGKPEAPAAGAAAKPGSSAAKGAPPKATPVLLLAPEDVRTVDATLRATGPVISGSLQPERRADLRAEVGATVQQVLKDNGQLVLAGELLVRLDDTAIRESLLSAEESVRAASQAFEQAGRQVVRLRTLQGQGMSSMQALEDAEVRSNNANSELVAARARVATARQQLRRTEVRAPFAGVVSARQISAGDTVQVGRELVKVIDPGSLRFEGLVTADRLQELKIGQPVSFRVNGSGDRWFAGKVRRIDSAANATTRQVAVQVGFDEATAAPRVAGLFAEGRIETGGAQQLMLPEGTVIRSGDSAHVWKVGDGQVQKVAVKLGERDPRSGEFPVLSGLASGDRVLRSPAGSLVDGQKFEFAKPAAAAVAASAASR
ncbi:MAG: efflux RND transporter periplasmic adaptor subunit [Ideonella sp. WA131b]|jgi:RND family efflux transporter MFP subunit|nr:efflux RND transporter periplasmic adaptor subunit [Ideonella sp. WA131b]